VPFQRNAFVREPAVVALGVWIDEVGCEKGVEAGEEEGEACQAREGYLVSRVG